MNHILILWLNKSDLFKEICFFEHRYEGRFQKMRFIPDRKS